MIRAGISYFTDHWRGRLPLGWTLVVNLVALRLAVWAVIGRLPAPFWALASMDGALMLWQVVGSLRAIRQHQKNGGEPMATWAGYFALLVCLPLFPTPHLDRLARMNARAPEVTVLAPPRHPGLRVEGERLYLEGEISLAMLAATEHLLAAHPGVTTLVLTSDGGQVHAARGLARLVREGGRDTYVETRCLSACTLVFIAGTRRRLAPGGQLGFHAYRLASPIPIQNEGTEQDKDRAAFLNRGVAPEFVARIYAAGPDEMWFPGRETLLRAGVLTSP